MGFLDKLKEGINAAEAADLGANLDGTKLYLKQNVTVLKDHYDVVDAEDKPVYSVQGNVIGHSFDITAADGRKVATISKKLVAVAATYDIEFANGSKASFKKKIALVKSDLNGTFDGKELTVKGDAGALEFEITVGGQKIGNVAKKLFAIGDSYVIAFEDETWKEAMVALAVAIDNAFHNDKDND